MILSSKACVVAGLLATSTGVASATVHMTVDYASAYFFRGTYTDGHFIQPNLEVSGFGMPAKYGSVQLGFWGNYALDGNDGTVERSEFSEIDWSACYSLPSIIENIELFIGYIEYIYPNEESVADKEALCGIGYEADGLALGATAYSGVGGDINSDMYYSFSAYYTVEACHSLDVWVGTQVGYYDPDEGSAGWNDETVDLGVTYSFGEVWYVGAAWAYVTLLDTGDDETLDSIEMIGRLRLGAVF